MATSFLSDEEEAMRYITLVEAVIDLAIVDYKDLVYLSAIRRDGSVNDFFWSRRAAGGYRHPKNLAAPRDAVYLLNFLNGETLDLLCDHLPSTSDYAHACRIRSSLGLPQRKPNNSRNHIL